MRWAVVFTLAAALLSACGTHDIEVTWQVPVTPQPTTGPVRYDCNNDELDRYKQQTFEHHQKRQRAFNQIGVSFGRLARNSELAADSEWQELVASRLTDMEIAATLMFQVPPPNNYMLRMAHDELVGSAEKMLVVVSMIRLAIKPLDDELIQKAADLTDRAVDQLSSAYTYADQYADQCL